MNTNEHGYGWEETTKVVIGCAYRVANALGAGFLEKVYENALALEIRRTGMHAIQQHPVVVRYEGVIVGEYAADILVQDQVLVELKACRAVDEVHLAQCLNYLKATGCPVCLLINFGTPRITVRRLLNPDSAEGWVDREGKRGAGNAASQSETDSSIRVHPCSSVVPPL